ncbi:MAG: peptidoglycan bridge formation glycyltransferase FemA/FemB family protein [Candidatus Gracilibacteria bacterium]|jgi:lipid II:glycine glycyltransferase (peptidoglycan interpeptide bridge formation enzyme)
MKIIQITENQQEKYNQFVQNHPLGSIHQTWEWGMFQCKTPGRDRFYALVQEDEHGQWEGAALIIRQQLPKGLSWLYCPRGPLVDYSNLPKFLPLFQKIAEIAKKENAVFLRFDPGLTESPDFSKTPPAENLNFQKTVSKILNSKSAHAHYQPESTLILDLSQSPEELLKQMKPKGRYNIKIAQKHGITICVSDTAQDLKNFYQLLHQTTTRDQFSGHALEFYQNMLTILGPQKAKLYLAEYQTQPVGSSTSPGPHIIAGLIATYFKDTAIYYFGASSNEYRNTMAPYLLQWQAILDAQKLGYKYYDFLGIAPEDQPNHPWAGVSDFKLKFGGTRLNYVPPQEIVYKPLWFNAIKLAKKLRR